MNIQVVNPLSDDRWDDLVACHPKASVFHGKGWLQALSQTYGYEPRVLTNSPAGSPLTNGIVMCRVSSWLTGSRFVSLPYSDHCDPLTEAYGDLEGVMSWQAAECNGSKSEYIELRPLHPLQHPLGALQASSSYCFHELDLHPTVEQLFRGLHKDSIQRSIRRAEKEGLSYEIGNSEELVNEFYKLLMITRRRHRLLPQPRAWFRNLVQHLGAAVQIRLARKNTVPIAAILSLRHRTSVVYKYGCSDARFHSLGGMPFLLWRMIEESKAAGADRLDLGRSDIENEGLIRFKDKFGATRSSLTYYRYVNPRYSGKAHKSWDSATLRALFCSLPDAAFSGAGSILYRHMG